MNRLLPQHAINATLRRFEQAGGRQMDFLWTVFEDGPAHLAGLKPGDMLLAVDGTLKGEVARMFPPAGIIPAE
jgi:predicted metalloprotease with PDZ domain